MISSVFMAALAIASSGIAQSTGDGPDDIAFTCLSKGPVLWVATLAAGTQSPNEHAAKQASVIAETCRVAKESLAAGGHVCLKAIDDNARLADQLRQVYAGQVSAAGFAESLDGDPVADESQQQIESNAACDTRMAALQDTTMAGENQ